MFKSVWGYVVLAISITVVSGGLYYYYSHYSSHVSTSVSATPSLPEQKTSSGDSSDELNRKRQAGIGSIKDLKPVQIPPAIDQAPRK